MEEMHPYERLPLSGTGIALGLFLVAMHAFFLARPVAAQGFFRRFSRNDALGRILLVIGMFWAWLLVAKPDGGFFTKLAMNLGEFDHAKVYMAWAIPVATVLLIMSVKEFLAVRALGLLGLMVAEPLLAAARQQPPTSRLLIPIYAYGLIVACLYFVGMPYLFRDLVTWVSASQSRWRTASAAGLLYGVAILICAFSFWKGY